MGLIITDFDGTLLSAGQLADQDLQTLQNAGKQGHKRAIATGRNLYSFQQAVKSLPEIPLDYLVFSTGAGIMDYKTGEILVSHGFKGPVINDIAEKLAKAGFDFMLQQPIPNTHHFNFYHTGRENPSFFRRMQDYEAWGAPLLPGNAPCAICQFLIFEPNGSDRLPVVKNICSDHSVIHATSPLGDGSLWIEVFPSGVNKGAAAAWLTSYLGLEQADVMAVGNDYNDEDLLNWAKNSFVVADASPGLSERYQTVAPSYEAGFSRAVEKWIEK